MDKLSNYIYKLTAALVVFFVFCGQVTDVAAQVELVDDGASKEEISLPTPKQSAEELPPLEKIVDFVEYDRTIPSPIEDEKPIYVDTVVRYTYIDEPTTKTILNGSTEQVDTNTYRVYSGQSFIQDLDDTWYELKSDVMKPEVYDQVLTEVLTEKSYLQTKYALAQETIYSTTDSGETSYQTVDTTTGAAWATLHDGNGTHSDKTLDTQRMVWIRGSNTVGNATRIGRTKHIFNTSALDPDPTEITFNVYITDSTVSGAWGGASTISLVHVGGANADSTASDYQTFTTEMLSDTEPQVDELADGWASWDLNANGLDEFQASYGSYTYIGTREGYYDKDNVTLDANDTNYIGCTARTADYTGTDYDPYLEITYGEVEPEPDPVATTTTNALIVDMPYTQELTMITAMTVIYGTTTGTSTPLAVEYTYYHIPLVAWLIIAYLLMNSLWFIYAQVKNYDRRR